MLEVMQPYNWANPPIRGNLRTRVEKWGTIVMVVVNQSSSFYSQNFIVSRVNIFKTNHTARICQRAKI